MKIALLHEAITYWLAGQPEVSERVHSSAADLVFTGDIQIDIQGRVRASSMAYRDRGNLSAGLSFSTWRKFTTLAEAEEYSAVYDAVNPRTGYVDLYGASGSIIARLQNAVVRPPVRAVTGTSVKLDYTVVGGAWVVPDGEGGFETPEITMGGEFVTMGS